MSRKATIFTLFSRLYVVLYVTAGLLSKPKYEAIEQFDISNRFYEKPSRTAFRRFRKTRLEFF